MRKSAVGLALLLTAIAATASASASGIKNPRSFALRLSDMPVGFTQAKSLARSTAQAERADHLAKGSLFRHGRLAGYETEFNRSTLVGMVDVDDTVLEYSSAMGAQWQLAFSMRGAGKPYKGHHFQRISIGSIGDRSVGYVLSLKTGSVNLTLYVVMFRRGSYAAQVETTGLTGTVAAQQTVNLAHVVDRRIQAGS